MRVKIQPQKWVTPTCWGVVSCRASVSAGFWVSCNAFFFSADYLNQLCSPTCKYQIQIAGIYSCKLNPQHGILSNLIGSRSLGLMWGIQKDKHSASRIGDFKQTHDPALKYLSTVCNMHPESRLWACRMSSAMHTPCGQRKSSDHTARCNHMIAFQD